MYPSEKETERMPLVFEDISEFKNYLFNPFSVQLLSDNKDLLVHQIEKLGLSKFDRNTSIEQLKDIF